MAGGQEGDMESRAQGGGVCPQLPSLSPTEPAVTSAVLSVPGRRPTRTSVPTSPAAARAGCAEGGEAPGRGFSGVKVDEGGHQRGRCMRLEGRGPAKRLVAEEGRTAPSPQRVWREAQTRSPHCEEGAPVLGTRCASEFLWPARRRVHAGSRSVLRMPRGPDQRSVSVTRPRGWPPRLSADPHRSALHTGAAQ